MTERRFNNLIASYDDEAKASYFALDNTVEVHRTISWIDGIDGIINLDLDQQGNVVGIEVLL